MEWNHETIGRLEVLWDEGHSTAEIARRMGISKNAVVGKAHRLNLTARPSPIHRDPNKPRAPRRPRRTHGSTLPELTTQAPIQIKVYLAQEQVRPVLPTPTFATPSWKDRSRTQSCCWPEGEPGTKSFRFCDDPSTPGKPYCAEHALIAYVKIRDRREDTPVYYGETAD